MLRNALRNDAVLYDTVKKTTCVSSYLKKLTLIQYASQFYIIESGNFHCCVNLMKHIHYVRGEILFL